MPSRCSTRAQLRDRPRSASGGHQTVVVATVAHMDQRGEEKTYQDKKPQHTEKAEKKKGGGGGGGGGGEGRGAG
eukprot:COSAG02_NODE_18274_length_949_cov_1.136471_2_plen_73_part_01